MYGGSSPALLRLLQLASPSLPVGAFAYSEGLEAAVAQGWVCDAETAGEWLGAGLRECLAPLDLPVCLRLQQAWHDADPDTVRVWSRYLLTARETTERRAQERHLGQALANLLAHMAIPEAAAWRHDGACAGDVSFAALWTLAATRWGVDPEQAATGLAWTWLENQVLAAVKLVPLGQTRGQILLHALAAQVPAAVGRAAALDDAGLGGSLPGLTLASTAHETLYSRLYRS